MHEYNKLYNLMALIIRWLVDSNIEPSFFSTYTESEKIEEVFKSKKESQQNGINFIINNVTRLLNSEASKDNAYLMILYMNELEEYADRLFKEYIKSQCDKQYVSKISFTSLNTDKNIHTTEMIIYPKVHSIWEGNSGNSFHNRTWDMYLVYTSYILVEDLEKNKCDIQFHYLNGME